MSDQIFWPNAVCHVDGDAFFAGVFQAVNPILKNKPVVVGRDRGIAIAVSYEARCFGVKRGMLIREVKKLCPHVEILPCDFDLFTLFSEKMAAIVEKHTLCVERYSIDEVFADVSGLNQRTVFELKSEIENTLGLSVSVGVSLSKTLAKAASNSQKPGGLTVLPLDKINPFLACLPVQEIWGIGPATAAKLETLGINFAGELIGQKEIWVRRNFEKPIWEIWQELWGKQIYPVDHSPKNSLKSTVSSGTFDRPSSSADFLWARLWRHCEIAFAKLRGFQLKAKRAAIFLKTQKFKYLVKEISFTLPVDHPFLVQREIKKGFLSLFSSRELYRACGICLSQVQKQTEFFQQSLFAKTEEEEKKKKICALASQENVIFGLELFSQEKKKKIFSVPMLNVN